MAARRADGGVSALQDSLGLWHPSTVPSKGRICSSQSPSTEREWFKAPQSRAKRATVFSLLVLSVALAMDAFAVSLVRGSVGQRRTAHALELGFAFGLAQGLMPLAGWGLGMAFSDVFRTFDHWIAFVLLSILGARMLFEGSADEEEHAVGSHSRWLGLLTALARPPAGYVRSHR